MYPYSKLGTAGSFNLRIESLVIESSETNQTPAGLQYVSISELRVLLLRAGIVNAAQSIILRRFNLRIESLVIESGSFWSAWRSYDGTFQSQN